MESTMTYSQLADMIIIITFSAVVFSGTVFAVVNAILEVTDLIKEKVRERKERKAKALEQAAEQTAE